MKSSVTLVALTLGLLGCGASNTELDHSASYKAGNVTVRQDATGIYSRDGHEQFVFRYAPAAPRSLSERVQYAQAAIEAYGACSWGRQDIAMIDRLTRMEPGGAEGYTLVALVRCR